ncbi:putative FBD-associated F-box protein At5g53635 [Vicia villosa]|uniref:putative FBD-associated F-box protein At5g53635 n=1 Tax=Vicia villosa TaxID=3911 RepID=UPI00273B255A|nr:putative FBD-associated F-box protein At5g53635 [Vicia villosa]
MGKPFPLTNQSLGKSKSLLRKMMSISVQSVHQQHVRSIRLRCASASNYFDYEEEDSANFNTWITAAAKEGLKHIHIHISWIFYQLGFIFSLRTLVVLDLKFVCVHAFGKVDLPSLKTLRLNRVEFSLDFYLTKLLNGCPNLEEFEGISLSSVVSWDTDIEYKSRSLSKLARASISHLDEFNIPFDIFSSVEFFLLKEIVLDDLPVFANLTRVEVVYVRRSVYWKLVFGVFENCPKLQEFFLGKPPILISEDILWYCPCVVPECLCLQFRKCTVMNYMGEKYEKEFVKYIVENSTSLPEMAMHTPASLDPQRRLEIQNELENYCNQ